MNISQSLSITSPIITYLRLFFYGLCCILALNLSQPLQANEDILAGDPLKVELVAEENAISPTRPFWVALHFKLEDAWHLYWKNPGEGGMPPKVEWTLPEGFTVEAVEWPTPQKFLVAGMTTFGYHDDATFLVKINPGKTAPAGPVVLSANLSWVVCSNDTCLPGDAVVSLPLTFTNETPVAITSNNALFEAARAHLPIKNATAVATFKDGEISLDLKMPHLALQDYDNFVFFSEQPGVVSEASDVACLEDKCTVKMKRADNPTDVDKLKGVLVMAKGLQKDAFEVDAPLFQSWDDQQIISLAEKSGVIATESTLMAAETGFLGALVLAFFGGMILNLMPCVLPVLSLKVLGFVQLAGKNRLKTFKHGLAFSAGVMISFWLLAGLLLVLQAYGTSVGWGFQLQEPIFVAGLAILMLMFALSLFGVFELGTMFSSWAGNAASKKNMNEYSGSFFSGVLATAVATPCTGPFLGTAIGYAVTLASWKAMLVFSFVGLGMSFPYIALSAFPSLLKKLPKPGAWMVTFKELMGFLMLAAVLWLFWVFRGETNELASFAMLIGLFVVSFGGWLYGRLSGPLQPVWKKVLARVLILSSLALSGFLIYSTIPPKHEIVAEASVKDWETFSPEKVDDLLKQGVPVFVDFTAQWCLICQANHLVLSTDKVTTKFDEKGVVKMKGDWTRNDPVITQTLKKHGRNSVPLYLLYLPGQSSPIVLPQVLTPKVVIETLEKNINENVAAR